MELKSRFSVVFDESKTSSNRTFMELKYEATDKTNEFSEF